MPKWINRAAGVADRNGTTTHTLTIPATTSGSLLVAVVAGAVTDTFPAGWTKQGSQVNATEICVATKTASAGETSVAVTHNGSNWPITYAIYEFPAGTTFGVVTGQANVPMNNAWSTLGSIPTGSTVMAALDTAVNTPNMTGVATAWTTPATEDVDQFTAYSGNEGAYLSLAYVDSFTGGSLTPASTSTVTGAATGDSERLIFSVQPAGTAPANTAPTANAGPDQTIQATYTATGVSGPTVTLTGAASIDPDGTIASYAWTQTSGTAVTLSGTGATRTFTAPKFGGTLVFGLIVTDNAGATSTQDTVQVTVSPVAYGYARVAGSWVKRAIFIRRSGAWT